MRLSPRPVVASAVLTVALLPTAGPALGSSVSEPSSPPGAHLGEEVCVSAVVNGGEGTVCARRDRFGIVWELTVSDSEDDGRDVTATIVLDVADARDPAASLRNDLGAGTSADASGSFHPRFGSAIGDLAIKTCVDIRFRPDPCHTSVATVPQLASQATPAQARRLEELVFAQSLDEFVTTWGDPHRNGVDADFDWDSDGCSAGPLASLFEEDLEQACLRHDFAYRNLGQLSYGPTDQVRARVDGQLARDVAAMGRGNVGRGLLWALQRFAAPVYFGEELADVWGVPSFIAAWLRTESWNDPAVTPDQSP